MDPRPSQSTVLDATPSNTWLGRPVSARLPPGGGQRCGNGWKSGPGSDIGPVPAEPSPKTATPDQAAARVDRAAEASQFLLEMSGPGAALSGASVTDRITRPA